MLEIWYVALSNDAVPNSSKDGIRMQNGPTTGGLGLAIKTYKKSSSAELLGSGAWSGP